MTQMRGDGDIALLIMAKTGGEKRLKLYGQTYARREFLARVGSPKQVADIRRATLNDGRQNGTEIFEIQNGVLSATVVAGRCLDIANFTYRGVPMQFTGKNGIVYAGFAEPVRNPLRSVNGGLFYTCGLTNVGAAFGDDYFHGRVRLIPAEQAYACAEWEGDEYLLRCGGVMRQNGVCYENLSLTRNIETALGSDEICVSDTVCNDGFSEVPFMMMYHVVFGFPLLNDGARLYVAADMEREACCCTAPDAVGTNNGGGVFAAKCNKDGVGMYCLYNPALSLGLQVRFDARSMPYLSQWKSMQSGDYAMGLMPTNCHAAGRESEMERGTLQYLSPDACVHTSIAFRAFSGEEARNEVLAQIDACTYDPLTFTQ